MRLNMLNNSRDTEHTVHGTFHSNIRVTIQSHPGNVFGQICATTDKVFVVDWLCKGCKHYCATEFPQFICSLSIYVSS